MSTHIIPLLLGTLTLSLVLNIILAVWSRHLSISPSFKIPVQAIGRLRLWTALGPRIWIYGDIDHLGLINTALTSPKLPGMTRWNRLMTGVLCNIRARSKFLVYGGDEFGIEQDPADVGERRHHADARGFCARFQALLRAADYTADERAAIEAATGTPHVTITLAYCYSPGWRSHRAAFQAAQLRVLEAKPKDDEGQRGEILEAALPASGVVNVRTSGVAYWLSWALIGVVVLVAGGALAGLIAGALALASLL